MMFSFLFFLKRYFTIPLLQVEGGKFEEAQKYAADGLKESSTYLPADHELINLLKSEQLALQDLLSCPNKRQAFEQINAEHNIKLEEEMRARPKLNDHHRVLIKSMVLERRCEFCKEFAGTLRLCSACKSVYYCGKEHQTIDWPKHKLECKQFAASE